MLDDIADRAPPIEVPSLLVKVDRTLQAGVPLPEAALGWWLLDEQRGRAVRYLFAVAAQKVLAVYEVEPSSFRRQREGDHGWPSDKVRYGWSTGHPHEDFTRLYADTSVVHLFPPGAAGAVRYQNVP